MGKLKRSDAQMRHFQAMHEARLASIAAAKKKNESGRETRSVTARLDTLSVELQRKSAQVTEIQELSIKHAMSNDTLQTAVKSLKMQCKESTKSLTLAMDHLARARTRATESLAGLRYARRHVRRLQESNSSLHRRNQLLLTRLKDNQTKLTRIEAQVRSLRVQIITCKGLLRHANERLHLMQYDRGHMLFHLRSMTLQLQRKIQMQHEDRAYSQQVKDLLFRIHIFQRKYRALQMQAARAKKRIEQLRSFKTEAAKTIRLTQNGIYTTKIRSLVRRLASLGVPMTKCGRVIGEFLKFTCIFFGIDSANSKTRIRIPSVRTISRIIGEGNVASKIQLGHDFKLTNGFTTGGDGTTNKNQNFESFNINVTIPETYSADELTSVPSASIHAVRFGEVRLSANHRAETQMQGDTNFLEGVIDLYNKSPLGSQSDTSSAPLSTGTLALKYHGSHGDHAEDQKAKHRLLTAWKEEMSLRGLGARYLYSMPEVENDLLVREATRSMILDLGGESVWMSLSAEERERKNLALMDQLAESLAGVAILALSESERRQIRVFVWTGCGMHKELNSVKGGDSAMHEAWTKLGMTPVLLANKDNTAVLELGEAEDDEHDGAREETAAEKRAREVSKSGGVKLASLVGALLNHKDDKKGQHHSFRDYAASRLGRTFTFPDTSNTRYSSYLDAAAELLANRDIYVDYMHIIRFSKEKQTLNNLETNVLNGLEDLPTLTELACLALYREAVSIPYISSIRGTGLEDANALELGSVLQKVKSHINKLLSEPGIILSPHADAREAILFRNEHWNRPDAVSAIQVLISETKLPKLEDLFKAFLIGALSTWERFSSEFNDDGIIAALTEAERQLAWMPTTNDANEGALGSFRVFARKNPNGTLKLFNSVFRYRRNDTEKFIETMLTGEEHQAFLRKQARMDDAMGMERKRRREVDDERVRDAATKKQKYEARRQKRDNRDEHLRGVQIQLDPEMIKQMTIAELKDQLDKLRKVDRDIPPDSRIKKKADKQSALLEAVDRLFAANCTSITGYNL